MLISGYIKDRHGNLAANVKVRACRKDNGLVLSEATTMSSPLGYYELSSDYTGEVDLIFISPDGVKNDMIYRATIL